MILVTSRSLDVHVFFPPFLNTNHHFHHHPHQLHHVKAQETKAVIISF